MIKRLQQQDDHKLVASVLAGDNRAFRVLAERHHGIIQAAAQGQAEFAHARIKAFSHQPGYVPQQKSERAGQIWVGGHSRNILT